MSRLTDRFVQLKEKCDKALVCYVVAGDPNIESTIDVILALDRAGVDVVELGIPFSDPLADGPSIQAGSQRALANGITVSDVFSIVRRVRETSQIPIVLMTYFNPALRYGVEEFAKDAANAGVDGVIQTDLTPEEADDWVDAARVNSLDTVFLVAPTSTENRIEVVAKLSTGFVYAVSRTGVTGARSEVPTELPELISAIKNHTNTPVCVGFGISLPEHVATVAAYADGVVVGSSLVDLIGKYGQSAELVVRVEEYVSSLKAATRSARL